MIWSWIFDIIFEVLTYFIAKLPAVSSMSGVGSAITIASGYISVVYNFLPLITITVLAILVFDIVFESAYLLYKAVYWVIRRFPTQS